MLAVGTDAGVVAQVRVFVDRDGNGPYESLAPGIVSHPVTFTPYANFTGGVRIAMGDFDGDGNDELVTGAGTGGGPHIIIWDMNPDGTVGGVRDSFLAFPPAFFGGVFVAAGDLNNDTRDELVISTDAGIATQVRIYSDLNRDGRVSDSLVDQLSPFGTFGGGARIALGNTNSSAGDELIVAAGPGGGPHVKIYTDVDRDGLVTDHPLVEEFFAFAPGFTGGVWLTAGLSNYLAAGAGAGGGPHVRIFRDSNQDGRLSNNPLFEEFFAYDAGFTGGVRVQADANNLGLVTAPGPGGGAHVKIFSDNSDAGSSISDNALVQQFLASGDSAGAYLAAGRVQRATYSRAAFQSIPDLSTITSSLWVPASAGTIRELSIDLVITHTNSSDLSVTLRHVPSGRGVTLFTNVGGASDGLTIHLNDFEFTDIRDALPPSTGPLIGRFKPERSAQLSTFAGLDATGEWQLIVTDDASVDVGQLVSWSLIVGH